VRALLIGLVAGVFGLSGCGADGPDHTVQTSATPATVPDVRLDELMLSVDDINAAMGATGMRPQPAETEMGDNRNLLPNLNCLGVWQPDEASIYGKRGEPGGWSAMRRQMLRAPDVEQWDFLAVQSVISYPTADAAKAFFDQSADRWSKCTNHHVNITLNDKPLPKWLSGSLDRTPTRLSMPISRGVGGDGRSCQHVLGVSANIVIDVETCVPQHLSMTPASAIADRIEAVISAV
jgi:hypothetical protein